VTAEKKINQRIKIIGCGKMASAILDAWLKKSISPQDIYVDDPKPSEWLLEKKKHGLNINTKADVSFDYCFIGVKPQSLDEIKLKLKGLSKKNVTFVSMLAGIKINRLEDIIGKDESIVRIMPNLPAEILKGVTAVKENKRVEPKQSKNLALLLEAFGETVKFVEERKFDAVTAISGSGPAYIFLIAELMTEVGINLGLSYDEAFKLVKHTIDGAGSLIVNSSLKPQKLRENVTSPGGTTHEALAVMMNKDNGLPKIFSTAIKAAAQRSKELSKV
jgi:pyrroline-5-carboxylate reductase